MLARRLGAFIVGAVLVAACAEYIAGPKPGERDIRALQLSAPQVTLDDGQTVQLTATALDQAGKAFDELPAGTKLEWASSATDVITVDAAGTLTAGVNAAVDLRMYDRDPMADQGLSFDNVHIDAAGDLIATFVVDSSTTNSAYPLTIDFYKADSHGQGQGKLMPVARIETGEDGVFEIETYASEPVRLTQVQVVK